MQNVIRNLMVPLVFFCYFKKYVFNLMFIDRIQFGYPFEVHNINLR